MERFNFATMSNENLRSVYHDLTHLVGILTGHYQSLIFDTSVDVYFIGSSIEKMRDMLKEASDEIDRRAPKPAI